jgi:hypothetical protein
VNRLGKSKGERWDNRELFFQALVCRSRTPVPVTFLAERNAADIFLAPRTRPATLNLGEYANAADIVSPRTRPAGTRVRVLFEDREIVAEPGYFVDNFRGQDLYQRHGGGAGYGNAPVALHLYELP